jgi:hypothetical protein
MKKILLTAVFSLTVLFVFAQAKTSQFIYYKVKMGHRLAFNEALKTHVAKFRKAGTPYAWAVFSLVGGAHHSEVMALSNIGKSWAERDELSAMPANTEASADFYLKVAPYIESVTGGDIIIYQPEYSNSGVEDRSAKLRTNMLTLKYAPAQEFWDVIKRLPKAWEKSGIKIATYQSSGAPRLIFVRRMPNGWKELDTPSALKANYDELYGKGSYERDLAIMRNYVVSSEITFMTAQPDLSSK